MRLELITDLSQISLTWAHRPVDWAFFSLYLVIISLALYHYRAELHFSTVRRTFVFVFLVVCGGLSAMVVRGSWEAGADTAATPLVYPVLATLPSLLAATWLGAAPALLVGLGTGIAYAMTSGLTNVQAVAGAVFALLLAMALRQRHRGLLFKLLRQPIVSVPALTWFLWPVPLYAHLDAAVRTLGQSDVTATLLALGLPAAVIGLATGIILQALLWLSPAARSAAAQDKPASQHTTLAGRILAQLLSLTLITALLCVLAITAVAARFQATEQMISPLLLVIACVFSLLTAGTFTIVQLQLAGLRRLAAAMPMVEGQEGRSDLLPIGRADEIGHLSRDIQHLTVGLANSVSELQRLAEISQSVSPRVTLEQTLQTLLRGIERGMSVDCAGVHRFRPENKIHSLVLEGKESLSADTELCLEELSRAVRSTGKPHLVSDVETESPKAQRDVLLRAGIRSLVVTPMGRDTRPMGALWAYWTTRRLISSSDVSFCATLANLAGFMIDNHQIYSLSESERRRLVAIVNSTRDGILLTDDQGRLLLANPAAEELLGFEAKTWAGRSLPDLLNSESLFRMLSSIARGKTCAPVDLEREGHQLRVSASLVELPDRQVPQGWILGVHDVTNMKRLDDMKTDFVNTITHNMKSPLTYMRGYASTLHMVGQINSEQSAYIEKIIKGIDDLTQQINELSELGEISNRVGLTMTPCQLYTIATEVMQNQRNYAEGKGLRLHTDLPMDLPAVVGDPRWLRQAIRNLIDNAIKYTMAPGLIKVSLKDTPDAVVICVADSGIGIAPADRRRIFEQFYRVRRKETLHIHGTGLGLSLVKKVAELHGGQTWVESELGKGSTFYLSIPKERRLADLLEEENAALKGTSTLSASRRASEERVAEKNAGATRPGFAGPVTRSRSDMSDLNT